MKDILGQDVAVGDIVVATNKSGAWHQFNIVTRLGSKDRVQVNGSGYIMAEYLLKINEQYVLAKGQEEADHIVSLYKDQFVHEQVKQKPAATRYYVFAVRKQKVYDRSTCKSDRDNSDVEFYCVSSNKETTNLRFIEAMQKACAISGKNLRDYSHEVNTLYTKKDYMNETKLIKFSSYVENRDFSFKSICEFGLQQWIDSKVEIVPQNLMDALLHQKP